MEKYFVLKAVQFIASDSFAIVTSIVYCLLMKTKFKIALLKRCALLIQVNKRKGVKYQSQIMCLPFPFSRDKNKIYFLSGLKKMFHVLIDTLKIGFF